MIEPLHPPPSLLFLAIWFNYISNLNFNVTCQLDHDFFHELEGIFFPSTPPS